MTSIELKINEDLTSVNKVIDVLNGILDDNLVTIYNKTSRKLFTLNNLNLLLYIVKLYENRINMLFRIDRVSYHMLHNINDLVQELNYAIEEY